MDRRLKLHDVLLAINGGKNVYFQPPSNVQMSYPAIVYKRFGADTKLADNSLYDRTIQYQVTVIDHNPDSVIPGKVAELNMCVLNRTYAANNLHHDVFNLYY